MRSYSSWQLSTLLLLLHNQKMRGKNKENLGENVVQSFFLTMRDIYFFLKRRSCMDRSFRNIIQPETDQSSNKMVRFTGCVVKMLSGKVLLCFTSCVYQSPFLPPYIYATKKIPLLACSRPINIEIFHFEEQKKFRRKKEAEIMAVVLYLFHVIFMRVRNCAMVLYVFMFFWRKIFCQRVSLNVI